MMSEERLLNPEPPTSEFNAEPRRGRRLQTGARTLVVLVATCGVVFWVAQYLWESQHPAYSAASGLLARSPTERVSAAKLLVQAGIGDTAIAIPPLVTALTDPAAEVRIAACGALRPLVSDAITTGSAADAVLAANTALIWSLNDPNADVRVATARVLEAIISLNVSAEMIDLDGVFLGLSQTIGDQVREVRIAALGALGSTACKLTTSPPAALTANLRDQSAAVRLASIKALASFQRDLDMWIPSIFEVLEHEDESGVRMAEGNALMHLQPPAFSASALPALVKGLSSRHSDVRFCACCVLAALGPNADPSIPNLIETMSDPIDLALVSAGRLHPANWDPGWVAAQALSKIAQGTSSAGEVIRALTEVVRTGHPYRRAAAADALGAFGPAAVGAVPALIDELKKIVTTPAALADGHWAATALGKIAPGTPVADEAVSSLTEALGAASEYTRRQAINALLCFGPKAAVSVPRIRALINDPHAAVRSVAAMALTELEAAE
jgi:HEAT repeat protein